MRIFEWVKDTINVVRSYGEGQEFAEAWQEQGGEDINDESLRRWHVTNGYEGDWRAFNRGVRSILGPSQQEEEE